MGTVIVLDQETVTGLIEGLVASATINGTGQLVFTKQDGSTAVIGYVADHGNQYGLADDDHTQYAKADGSRGAFASTAQGAKADAARTNSAATVTITGGDTSTGYLEETTIQDDGSSTGSWINRWVWKFLPTGGGAITRLVTFINEYGELRGIPAKLNTVWLRIFIKDAASNPSGTRDANVPIMQVMDNRTDRVPIWGLYPNGKIRVGANEVETEAVIRLTAAASVPTGTPAGTIIVRTA